jgi:hypothetical protein
MKEQGECIDSVVRLLINSQRLSGRLACGLKGEVKGKVLKVGRIRGTLKGSSKTKILEIE